MGGAGGAFNNSDSLLHFGSVYGEFEFESTSQILFAGMNYQVSPDFNLTLHGSYSASEAAFNQIEMPLDDPHVVEAYEEIESANYDYSKINEYSDLSYDYLNLNVTMHYDLTDNLQFKLGMDYHDLTDNKTYVYGDETGSFFVITSGFKYGL